MLPVLEKYIKEVSQSIDSLDMNEVQYSEEFEAVESEIQKLQSLTPEIPDWDVIINKGKVILKEQGKHLKIITYIVVAMYKKYRLVGLIAGLRMLADIFANEQDQIMPYGKRKKSRASLITWMVKFIADYRDENYMSLSVEDLDQMESSKQKVGEWFANNEPNVDSLPLLQIYSWFDSVKDQIIAVQAAQEASVDETPKDDQKQANTNEIKGSVSTEKEDVLQSESEIKEFHEEHAEVKTNNSSREKLEVVDFGGVRDFVKYELLDRLDDVNEDPEELFKLMTQSRKVLWNSIYYDNLIDEIADTEISDDYHTLNNILYIQEPIIKIIELEKLYIKNPYLIELQKHILDALMDSYMRQSNTAFKNMHNFIETELKFLISQTAKIFDFSYMDKQCLPEYLYDWIFTELVEDTALFREKIIDEYLDLYEQDFKLDKMLSYINTSKSVELKMNYLLEAFELLDADNQAKIMFLEKHLDDKILIKSLINESAALKKAYESLSSLYESQITDIMELNPNLAEIISQKRNSILEKTQL